MTIEDFRKLKNGDKVIVWNGIYTVSVGWNHYRVPFTEFLMNNKSVYRIYDKESCGMFSVYENDNNFGEHFAHGKFKFVNDMEHYDEKKYLESQLKEEQRRIEQEILASNNKQAEIQKKLTELIHPKIGKMYELHDVRTGKYAIGVLVSVRENNYQMVITNKLLNCVFSNIHSSQTKLIPMDSSTDNIAKSIMEFIKLGEQ